MQITIDPHYPAWLRLTFPYSTRLVELVRRLPNRRWIADDKQWQVPALPEVLDALIDAVGAEMEPVAYEVLTACFPPPRAAISASDAARARDKAAKRAKFSKRKVA
jgi:hypothetical protein